MYYLTVNDKQLPLEPVRCTKDEILLRDYSTCEREPNRVFQMYPSIIWKLIDGDFQARLQQTLCLDVLVKAHSYVFRFPVPVLCGERMLHSYYRIFFTEDSRPCYPSSGFHHLLRFTDGSSVSLVGYSNHERKAQWYLVSLDRLLQESYWQDIQYTIAGFVQGQLLLRAEEQKKEQYGWHIKVGGEIDSPFQCEVKEQREWLLLG